MCILLPAQIMNLNDDTAIVNVNGLLVEVGRRGMPSAQPGGWVLVYTGQIVEAISADEALALQALLKELLADKDEQTGHTKGSR